MKLDRRTNRFFVRSTGRYADGTNVLLHEIVRRGVDTNPDQVIATAVGYARAQRLLGAVVASEYDANPHLSGEEPLTEFQIPAPARAALVNVTYPFLDDGSGPMRCRVSRVVCHYGSKLIGPPARYAALDRIIVILDPLGMADPTRSLPAAQTGRSIDSAEHGAEFTTHTERRPAPAPTPVRSWSRYDFARLNYPGHSAHGKVVQLTDNPVPQGGVTIRVIGEDGCANLGSHWVSTRRHLEALV